MNFRVYLAVPQTPSFPRLPHLGKEVFPLLFLVINWFIQQQLALTNRHQMWYHLLVNQLLKTSFHPINLIKFSVVTLIY